MFKVTLGRLVTLTVLTVLVTLLLLGCVVVEEPPGFFGYCFGVLNGFNWAGLVVLWLKYWELDEAGDNN